MFLKEFWLLGKGFRLALETVYNTFAGFHRGSTLNKFQMYSSSGFRPVLSRTIVIKDVSLVKGSTKHSGGKQ